MPLQDWTRPIPVYVSRQTANGEIAHVDFPGWFIIPAQFLLVLNVFLWGIVGVVEALKSLL